MANIGRQLFSPSDISANKAIALVTRVNRFFGYDWEAYPETFKEKRANINISCVDSAAARLELRETIRKSPLNGEPHYKSKYWLDIGNLQKTGQVVLGTAPGILIPQPESELATTEKLPDVVKLFPSLRKLKEEDQGPSCSLAQSLNRQDLFINSTLAQFGVNLIWKLFREGMIRYHGCYVNLETFIVNPIRINIPKSIKK
jgi:PRTRC genetic system ThiF family protein